MGNVYFFTGFPGFITKELVKECLFNREKMLIEHIYLLTLPTMEKKALRDIRTFLNEYPELDGLVSIIIGDITKKNLQISSSENKTLQRSVTHVFHLAAIYDLAVNEEIAEAVNVNGTKNVNDWVQTILTLKRYTYFSTAYVSGTREGIIYESELEMGQSFKNHYERTKYDAEVLVKGIMEKVPTTIIRPGVVRGNSETGETTKFDGPYFMLNIFDRLSFLPIIPFIGDGLAEGNFVPVDYVIEATLYLARAEIGVSKTYHLTDPSPYKMTEIYGMLCHEYLGKRPKGKLPMFLTELSLSLPFMRKWLKVEKEALQYNLCQANYDTSNADADLQGSGIRCPPFDETIKAMVDYYKLHKDNKEKHLHIV